MDKTKAFVAFAKECGGTSEPEPPITDTQEEEIVEQNVRFKPHILMLIQVLNGRF